MAEATVGDFTPDVMNDWIRNVSEDRVSAVTARYLRAYRDTLVREMAKGFSVKQLKEAIQRSGAGETVAATAASTLTTAAFNHALAHEYLKDPIVERFVFRAVIDRLTTLVCQYHDGLVFTKEELPFYLPPLHYRCRSRIFPVTKFDGDKYANRQGVKDPPPPGSYKAEIEQQAKGQYDYYQKRGFKNPEGFLQFTPKQLDNPTKITLKAEPREKAAARVDEASRKFVNKLTKAGVTEADALSAAKHLGSSSNHPFASGRNMSTSMDKMVRLALWSGQKIKPKPDATPEEKEKLQAAKDKFVDEILAAYNGSWTIPNIDAPEADMNLEIPE